MRIPTVPQNKTVPPWCATNGCRAASAARPSEHQDKRLVALRLKPAVRRILDLLLRGIHGRLYGQVTKQSLLEVLGDDIAELRVVGDEVALAGWERHVHDILVALWPRTVCARNSLTPGIERVSV